MGRGRRRRPETKLDSKAKQEFLKEKDPLEGEEEERKAKELERVERIRKEREDAAAGRVDPNLPVGHQDGQLLVCNCILYYFISFF